MEKVTGIGGLFFRAKDPKALADWYLKHLGIALSPQTYDQPSWQQQAGPTVFAHFERTSEYFKPSQAWMINFRVPSLERMKRQLEAAGIEVAVNPQQYPNGRFARIHDPEGNPIELWEVAGDETRA